MSIIIAYERYQHNWYVGELHHAFATHMSSKYNDIQLMSMSDMASKHNEAMDTRSNALASIFNIYNLIVYNTETNCSFLHCLADYAPVMLEHKSAIEKLNIKAFAFCPHYTQEVIDRYKNLNIQLIPSFYILENWNDHAFISQYANEVKTNKCYFNGLCYGHRELYVNHLQHNPFFVMKNKRNISDYKPKEDYYKELSQYKYGLSINGVAQICYRDIEYFGMGVLCIREPMTLMTKDNLREDFHYKTILDSYVTSNIYYQEKQKELANYIIDKINSISKEEELFILHNARTWYQNNALPHKQVEFLEQCVIQNGVL